MALSGKCKEEFEKWYLIYSTEDDLFRHNKVLTDSEKYGVYQDYFDSVGISAEAYKKFHCDKTYFESSTDGYLGAWKSRQEARKQTILKANEIFNNK